MIQKKTSNPFWQYDAAYWIQKLTSNNNGLSTADAETRLAAAGISKIKISPLQKDFKLFISQFTDPMMLLLIAAVIISAFLGDTSDVFIILFIVLSTGTLSFIQERNAGKVVEKLQSLIKLKCTVLRNEKPSEIPSDSIVPGDILLFSAGDMIPADCLLIEANELHVNEASLTGESYPVQKIPGTVNAETVLNKRTNALWEGTSVVSGKATAIVIETGNNTLFSQITKSANTEVQTSFETGIQKFSYFLMRIALILCAFILAVNLIDKKDFIESALFALALAVGIAPELLPAITTISMSAGAKRLLARKVIVKKLSSIQNFGELSLLCTDKTGTITEGSIEVSSVVNYKGDEDTFTRELAYWNAFLESGYSNPMDEALKKMKIVPEMKPEKTGEIPYDFTRKRLSIGLNNNGQKILVCKGAFQQIISVSKYVRINGKEEEITAYLPALQKQYEDYGNNGLRVIGVAYKPLQDSDTITSEQECKMIFSGFILLQDPVKDGILEARNELKSLNVGLKIITGDNRNVALSIGKKIGIENPVVMTGEELEKLTDGELTEKTSKTHIFAEVEPEQKEKIILALKKSFTVGYMGDGINDVAAINAADVGISVENATDIARESADFVLMEKDLSVLAAGIKEGRKTFANTLKYIYISTGSTFGNMCSMAVASLILPFLPMLPKQILLTNFLTDFPYLAVASDNVDEEQTANPGKWNISIIRNYMLVFGIHSSVFDIITFMVLLHVFKIREAAFQTGWFIESVLTELFILFIIRTHQNFFKSKPATSLIWLTLIALSITIALPYLPFAEDLGFVHLPLKIFTTMLIIVLTYIFTADLLKVWFFRRFKEA